MSMAIIQFGLYLGFMLGIDCYSMRRTQINDDFVIGGRTLGDKQKMSLSRFGVAGFALPSYAIASKDSGSIRSMVP